MIGAVDVEACPIAAADRREAEPVGRGPSGTNTECRSWKPSGAPAEDGQGQVELGRGETHDRRRASPRGPRRSPPPPALVAADRPEGLDEGQPLPDRQGLGPPVGIDAGAGEGRVHDARHRPAAAATGRCGASCAARGTPAWTSRHRPSSRSGVSRSSASNGSTTMTADSTAGLGLERPRRHAQRDADAGVVLDEDRQVAHLPGRRGDPLGDLALDHQHEALAGAAARPGGRAGSGW